MAPTFFVFPPTCTHVRSQRATHPRTAAQVCTPQRRLPTKACASAAPHASAPAPSAEKPAWKCMSNCGACCKLDDFEDDVLRDMLKSDTDVAEYLSLIDARTGWCKHFDSTARTCTIYDSRPRFCRATPAVFESLYEVPAEEFDEFAVDCCKFHIANTYGECSQETERYARFIRAPTSPKLPASGAAPQAS